MPFGLDSMCLRQNGILWWYGDMKDVPKFKGQPPALGAIATDRRLENRIRVIVPSPDDEVKGADTPDTNHHAVLGSKPHGALAIRFSHHSNP
ncbi:MAG: hypothetical protein KDJ70_12470 [Candidatus Competibacteraceae bacterium]|nr:hypothetical protein [Candidatus Competibacteraceae bacterium]